MAVVADAIVSYFARLRRDGPWVALTILPAVLLVGAWLYLAWRFIHG